MGLYSGGLIIGRIFAFEIWRAYVRESLFSEGLVIGILRHTVVECKKNFDHTAEPQETSSCREQFECGGMGKCGGYFWPVWGLIDFSETPKITSRDWIRRNKNAVNKQFSQRKALYYGCARKTTQPYYARFKPG